MPLRGKAKAKFNRQHPRKKDGSFKKKKTATKKRKRNRKRSR